MFCDHPLTMLLLFKNDYHFLQIVKHVTNYFRFIVRVILIDCKLEQPRIHTYIHTYIHTNIFKMQTEVIWTHEKKYLALGSKPSSNARWMSNKGEEDDKDEG